VAGLGSFENQPVEVWPMVRVFQPGHLELAQARSYAPEIRLLTRCAAPTAALCVVVAFVTGYFGWSTGLLHLAALYLVAERMRPWLLAKNESVADEADRVVRVSLDAEHVTVHQQPGSLGCESEDSGSYRWEELRGHYECPHCLVLLLPDGRRTILPARLFLPEQLEALRALLVGKAPRARVRWVSALRAPVIALALIVAWLLLELPR
jgi:hypothetical protein